MMKKTLSIFAFLAVLLASFTLASAAYSTTTDNVTLTIYNNSITGASTGDMYAFVATIENLNASDYYVEFGTTDWAWVGDKKTITSSSTENFTGILTIPSSNPNSKAVIAKMYNSSNNSQLLFQLSKSIGITYASTPVSGCTDSAATNYNSAATVDDGSCTYPSSFYFCEYGKNGTLRISDFEVSNYGNGEDDEWDLLDRVEISVEIENVDQDDDVRDVYVEIMIKDDQDNDVTKDFDFDDEKIDLGRVKEDSIEEAVFIIPEIPADMEEGDYRIYLKAYSDGDEDLQCIAESSYFDNNNNNYYSEVKVDTEYSSAAVVKKDLDSVSASCGQKDVQVTFDVYNLGTSKEDKVLVNLYDKELGVDLYEVIDGLRAGKRKSVTFTFDLPEELSKDKYNLDIFTHFDYDDDMDEMDPLAYDENSYDDLEEDFYQRLDILSCTSPSPSISASLKSDSIVGEELTIVATIFNNGDDNNFVVSASGFESWADLISIEPQSVSIDEDESQLVTIKLMPTKEGFQSFTIQTVVDGEKHEQSVSINIASKEGLFASMNAITYTIAGIIVLLVLIFLTLIIRLSRRTTRTAQF